MKIISHSGPLMLAMAAAVGNALVAIGQKKAPAPSNPFLFGSLTMGFASVVLFLFSYCYTQVPNSGFSRSHLAWATVSATGMVLLQVFLFFLYRTYGASYYSLYAVLAIVTTSVVAGIWFFEEAFTTNLALSLVFAFISIYFLLQTHP